MSKIFNDAERLEFMALFMENYIKVGDKAYEETGINSTTVYLWSIRYNKDFEREYPELYEKFLIKKEEIKKEHILAGLEKSKQTREDVYIAKAKYNSNNPIVKYFQDKNITSVKYNDFIDICISVLPNCETSVHGIMKKARKFNIDIIKDNKIIN